MTGDCSSSIVAIRVKLLAQILCSFFILLSLLQYFDHCRVKNLIEVKMLFSIFFFVIIIIESCFSASFHWEVKSFQVQVHVTYLFQPHSFHSAATTIIIWSSFELMSHYNEDCFTRDLHLNVSTALISSMLNYLKLRFNKIGWKSSKQCTITKCIIKFIDTFWLSSQGSALKHKI